MKAETGERGERGGNLVKRANQMNIQTGRHCDRRAMEQLVSTTLLESGHCTVVYSGVEPFGIYRLNQNDKHAGTCWQNRSHLVLKKNEGRHTLGRLRRSNYPPKDHILR